MATNVKIRTNGQTLTVQSSVSYWTTEALAIAASGTNDVESTTTTTITADYDLWFANTASSATITVKQPDGTTIGTYPLNVQLGVGPYSVSPLPDLSQLASDSSATDLGTLAPRNDLSTGCGTTTRMEASSTATMSTQTLRLSMWTAPADYTVSTITSYTGGTGAGATPSLIRYGLYTVASDGAITLVASTAHDATLLVNTGTAYPKALSSSYAVTKGARYATGLLVVTAATAPVIASATSATGALTNRAARQGATIGSQSDLPASVANASLASTAAVPYFEMT